MAAVLLHDQRVLVVPRRPSEDAFCHNERRAWRDEALITRNRPREEQHHLPTVVVHTVPDAEHLIALRGAGPATSNTLRLRRIRSDCHPDVSRLIWFISIVTACQSIPESQLTTSPTPGATCAHAPSAPTVPPAPAAPTTSRSSSPPNQTPNQR